MAKFKYLIFLISYFFSVNSFAQDIKNVRITQEGKTIVVLYDIAGKSGTYNVNLFYTLDDWKTWQGPLKNVSGDVTGQMPGNDKKVIWNVAAEKVQLEGNIQFKLNAEMISQPVQSFSKPIEQSKTKTEYSPKYYKYKKSKNIWLSGALVSGAVGAFTMLQSNNLYSQYQSATNDAESLHQKVKLYDQISPIAFGVAGICTLEIILKAGKQSNVKNQTLGFYPQPIHQGVGLGLVCKF
ncbi:MAG: hypothetical protein JZU47_10240 [Prolixibacteraceae bacterium]|nr:hypothetical protein [Prolixibacteraceae bacterium]